MSDLEALYRDPRPAGKVRLFFRRMFFRLARFFRRAPSVKRLRGEIERYAPSEAGRIARLYDAGHLSYEAAHRSAEKWAERKRRRSTMTTTIDRRFT